MIRELTLLLAFAGIAHSQENGDPDLAREKAIQWIAAKKAISAEAAQWDQDKEMLTDLIELRNREIEQMAEVIEQAKERVVDIEKRTSDLKKQERNRKAWRAKFEKKVLAIEEALIPKLSSLPPSMRNQLSDAIERVEDRDDASELQNRFRDVIAILNECISFNSQIHTLQEIHEIDGKQIEVDVLYLGMNQAWFVDPTNRIAAMGSPQKDGWVWKIDPSIAGRVRRAIDVQTKNELPAFVKLPLSNQGGKQ